MRSKKRVIPSGRYPARVMKTPPSWSASFSNSRLKRSCTATLADWAATMGVASFVAMEAAMPARLVRSSGIWDFSRARL